jgi:OH-DDVA oxygenase/3-O-methylgallate 3,4-dioxygenase
VVASGGLSHFTLDEETDRMLLDGLEKDDAETLSSIPRHRLHSAASEMLNWVTLGGVMHESDLNYELIDYVPVTRTPAGTGGGWGFTQWTKA